MCPQIGGAGRVQSRAKQRAGKYLIPSQSRSVQISAAAAHAQPVRGAIPGADSLAGLISGQINVAL